MEAMANRWPLNRVALKWLRLANQEQRPMAAYAPQLARWGVTLDKAAHPVAVRRQVLDLTQEGERPALEAMRWLVSCPDQTPAEAAASLERSLTNAGSPDQAAKAVLEVVIKLVG
jgi:hypothetical protein